MIGLLLAAALQAAPPPAPAQPPAATTAAPATKAELGRELLRLMRIDKQLDFAFTGLMPLMTENIANVIGKDESVDVELRAQLADERGRARIKGIIAEEVMAGFKARYATILERAADEYAARFSEAELRELIAFHRSPVGVKLLDAQPELQARLGKIGERIGIEVGLEAVPKALERITGASSQPTLPRT